MDLLEGVPGFRDLYPELWKEVTFIINNMRKVATRYAYQEYEGPSIEATELIEAKSGEDLISEIFQLTDKREKRLLLRPEQTPTLARMLAKEQQRFKRPIRWFSIPRLFRDETVQKGRLREFWQLNVDILGENSVSADAETIAVAIDICRECGLSDSQFTVFVNHRELLNQFIGTITDLSPQLIIPIIDKRMALIQTAVTRQMIKLGKSKQEAENLGLLYRRIISSSGQFRENLLHQASDLINLLNKHDELSKEIMIIEFIKIGLDINAANLLYEFTSIKGKPSNFINDLKNLNLPDVCNKAINEMELLGEYLESFGVNNPVIFDTSLARGLDYYTGIVFEIFDSTGEIVRAICGGGRYSDLVETIGGAPLSGVGFGMGDVVLWELLKLKNLIPDTSATYDLYLAPIKLSSIPSIIDLSRRLRSTFKVICNPFNWKVHRHFESADVNRAELVLLLGPKDIKNNQVSVRRVTDGSQLNITLDDDLEKNLRTFQMKKSKE